MHFCMALHNSLTGCYHWESFFVLLWMSKTIWNRHCETKRRKQRRRARSLHLLSIPTTATKVFFFSLLLRCCSACNIFSSMKRLTLSCFEYFTFTRRCAARDFCFVIHSFLFSIPHTCWKKISSHKSAAKNKQEL